VTFPLWIAARLQLGDSFSPWADARRLVTTGLYRRIRHPIYVFGGLACFGALVALQVWPIVWLWLALTPIQIVRIRREERVLAAAFGDAYREYRRGTWF
jgi:protein-S-isoprenylcysteine O-methyltransferase Ste14